MVTRRQNLRTIPHLLLSCLFILLVVRNLYVEAACDSLPLSISSLNVCEDGICHTEELAHARTQLAKDHAVCFKLGEQDFKVVSQTVNITFVSSWVSYPVLDCYISDDPQISLQGFCRCPLVGEITCANCPIPNIANSTNICSTGLTYSSGCIGRAPATYCMNGAFSGGNRYKVCEIGKPQIILQYSYFDGTGFQNGVINLRERSHLDSANSNITFTAIEKERDLSNMMIVLDLLNPGYQYLVPKEHINTRDLVSYQKLGWFRYNSTIRSEIWNYITSQVINCGDDLFSFAYGLPSFRDILNSKPEWQVDVVLPGALFSDPDADVIQAAEPIYDPPLPPLSQGAYFMTISGEIIPFGVDVDGVPVQSYTQTFTGTQYLSNQGLKDVTFGDPSIKCSIPFYMSRVNDSGTILDYYLQQCGVQALGIWAICRNLEYFTPPSMTINTNLNCTFPNFYGNKWPDNYNGEWSTYQSGGSLNFGQTATGIVESFNVTSDHLLSMNVLASAEITIGFKNVTVIFDQTNVKPEILSLNPEKDDIVVTVRSKTVKGECLLLTSDDICYTKSVTLYDDKEGKDYKLPIRVSKYKGDVYITVDCAGHTDQMVVYIEVSKDEVNIKENSIEPGNVRRASINQGITTSIAKSSRKVWDWIKGAYLTMFDLTSSSIGNWFLGIFLSILVTALVIASVPLIIYIIYKILCYLKIWYYASYPFRQIKIRLNAWRKKKIGYRPSFGGKNA